MLRFLTDTSPFLMILFNLQLLLSHRELLQLLGALRAQQALVTPVLHLFTMAAPVYQLTAPTIITTAPFAAKWVQLRPPTNTANSEIVEIRLKFAELGHKLEAISSKLEALISINNQWM